MFNTTSKEVIDSMPVSKKMKEYMLVLLDCEEFGNTHYYDDQEKSKASYVEAISLFKKLFSYTTVFTHSFFQTLKGVDYGLYNLFLGLYQSANFKFIICTQTSTEDTINAKLYNDTKTIAFTESLMYQVGESRFLEIEEKKEKWYNTEMMRLLGFEQKKELMEFHDLCKENGSIYKYSEKQNILKEIISSVDQFPYFLQVYDRWIVYTFGENAVREKSEIVETLCYLSFGGIATTELEDKHKALNLLFCLSRASEYFCTSGILPYQEPIVRFCIEGLIKVYYDKESCVYDPSYSSIVNAGDKQDKSLKLRTTIKKMLQIIYETLYLDITSFIDPGFYNNYQKKFSFREYNMWNLGHEAIQEMNIKEAKTYFELLEEKHKDFFRLKFNLYSIKFYELKQIILADKSLQATKSGKSSINSELIEEIKNLFHDRNVLIINEYPNNEIEEKLQSISIHSSEIERLTNLEISIIKIK